MIGLLESQEASRHKCLVYEGEPSEQLPVVIPMLVEALGENWRCLYLGDPGSVEMVRQALREKGVETDREEARGALVFSSEREHLADGQFDPKAMVDGLRAMIDDAVRDGYQGLCATGDMMWELGHEKNFDRLLEYEALLEQVFHEKPLQGICQYRKDVLPARAVGEALMSHQSVYVGRHLSRDNLFSLPPDLILEKNPQARDRQGEWMCQQIVRVVKAERKRDEAIRSLVESEAEQRRLAEELAAINRELEVRISQRTQDLEVSNQELKAFSYSVSHDLRAPLRAIDTLSCVLLEDFEAALGQEGAAHLDRVRASVRRMNDVVDGMLMLSRLTTAELRYENVDLGELATATIRELRVADPRRNVEVVIPDGLVAYGDRLLIRSALDNLIGNAWKFTAKRPSARIEIGRNGERDGRVELFVKDDGAGFDMRYANHLFGTFTRLHAQHEFPGTGIGLATVQRIVHRHGGTIWAEAEPGRGATFTFTLPATTSA